MTSLHVHARFCSPRVCTIQVYQEYQVYQVF
jgi:hypothetical protein